MVAMATESGTRREFHRVDGTRIVVDGQAPPRSHVRHRRAVDKSRLADVAGRVATFIRSNQKRFDFALAFVSSLLVAGTIFFVFGLTAFTFGANTSLAWTFWLMGLGIWMMALGSFFLFMNHPLPKHRKDR